MDSTSSTIYIGKDTQIYKYITFSKENIYSTVKPRENV